MKRFKFSKGIFLMLTLVLTLSLIPSKITYSAPTCCDRYSPGWERRGTDRERSSHKINCRTHNVVHYCEITETYRLYRKICLSCDTYLRENDRVLESTTHSVKTCH